MGSFIKDIHMFLGIHITSITHFETPSHGDPCRLEKIGRVETVMLKEFEKNFFLQFQVT